MPVPEGYNIDHDGASIEPLKKCKCDWCSRSKEFLERVSTAIRDLAGGSELKIEGEVRFCFNRCSINTRGGGCLRFRLCDRLQH